MLLQEEVHQRGQYDIIVAAVSVSGCTYSKFADGGDISDSVNSSFGDAKADGIFDVEDLAMGFIRFENGACLQIEFSWASNIEQEQFFVELRGTKSGLVAVKIADGQKGKTVEHVLPHLVYDLLAQMDQDRKSVV